MTMCPETSMLDMADGSADGLLLKPQKTVAATLWKTMLTESDLHGFQPRSGNLAFYAA
jgi:hypothetical protein